MSTTSTMDSITGAAIQHIAGCTIDVALAWLDKILIDPTRVIIGAEEFVEHLGTLKKNLEDHRADLQKTVEAKGQNRTVKRVVQSWLDDVSQLLTEADAFLNGLASSPAKRSQQGNEARDLLKKISVFFPRVANESASSSMSRPQPVADVNWISFESMPHPDFMEFESIKSTKHQIIEALREESCDIVGVVGIGRVGKTTLVKEVAKTAEREHMFDRVVMVVVSQSPNIEVIQDQIASPLGFYFELQAGEGDRASKLRQRILQEKSILVIIDDIWAGIDLNAVGIPHGTQHKGCKILLTTRKEDVCTVMGVRREKQIHVQVLSKKESWELFRKAAGDIIETPTFKKIAEDVMEECGGFPIALLTVGRALGNKDLGGWKAAKIQLCNSKPTVIEGVSKEVISCLKLSYDNLEGETTKLCFLLCCLFPEDHDTEIEVIFRYALPKVISFESVDTMEDARTIVVSAIEKLRGCCLLEESQYRYRVKMNDVVRDIAKSIASEGANCFLVRTGQGLTEWPADIPLEDCTAISFTSNYITELSGAPDAPKLQILSFAENMEISSIEAGFFERMNALTVLDLTKPGYPSMCNIDISTLQYLTDLRTLVLDYCALYDFSVIGKLQKLEILSLRGSRIQELPVEIGDLTNLRLLDLSKCEEMNTIPANVISRLSQLEELYMMRRDRSWLLVGKDKRSASFSEIQSLPRLTRVSLDCNDADFLSNFALPETVKYFGFILGKEFSDPMRALKDDRIFEEFCYPQARYLSIEGSSAKMDLDGLKKWLRLANTLKLAHLYLTNNEKWDRRSDDTSEVGSESDDLSQVILTDADEAGGLNYLKSLEVDSIKCIEALAIPRGKVVLPNLQRLDLDSLESMRYLGMGGRLPHGSLQNLRFLTIHKCGLQGPAVSSSWVQRLDNLENVKLSDCGGVTEVFDITETTGEIEQGTPSLLPNLKEMWLSRMPQLASIWKWNGNVNFPTTLTCVSISSCANLISIFPPGISGSISNLKTLQVSLCENVEVIFEESESEGIIQSINLPNLESLTVSVCGKLKSIFSVSTAQGSPKLEQIISCNGNGAEDDNHAEINWPHLSTMRLVSLQVLRRICPKNCSVHLPHLKTLDFAECDMMENFASDTTAYGLHIPQSVIPEVDEDRPELW